MEWARVGWLSGVGTIVGKDSDPTEHHCPGNHECKGTLVASAVLDRAQPLGGIGQEVQLTILLGPVCEVLPQLLDRLNRFGRV